VMFSCGTEQVAAVAEGDEDDDANKSKAVRRGEAQGCI
jgi:hypothetical protein